MILFDFQYNNKKLSDFDMICCNFDSSSGIAEVGAELTLNQEKPSGSNNFNLYSTSYDNPFTLPLSICLNPCRQQDFGIPVSKIRQMQKWLSNNRYHKFKILGNSEYENLFWNGTFVVKQVMSNDAVIGFNLTFTARTPYALQETENFNIEFSTSGETDIVINSDEYGYIDADYTITLKEAGDFRLSSYYYDPEEKNFYLDRTFKIANCIQGEIITVKGFNQLVSSSVVGRQLGKDCNFLLPRLINTYQTDDEEVQNKIVTNLACSIQIDYNPVAMVSYGYKS